MGVVEIVVVMVGVLEIYGPSKKGSEEVRGQDRMLTGEDKRSGRTLTGFPKTALREVCCPQRRACRTTTAPSANFNQCFSVQVPEKKNQSTTELLMVCDVRGPSSARRNV